MDSTVEADQNDESIDNSEESRTPTQEKPSVGLSAPDNQRRRSLPQFDRPFVARRHTLASIRAQRAWLALGNHHGTFPSGRDDCYESTLTGAAPTASDSLSFRALASHDHISSTNIDQHQAPNADFVIPSGLGHEDRALIESVVERLRDVCLQLPSSSDSWALRVRLHEARRILEGV